MLVVLYLLFRRVCCKRMLKRGSRRMAGCVLLSSFVISVLSILCLGIVIWYADTGFQSLQQLQCYSVSFPNDMIYGSPLSAWYGTAYVESQLRSISTDLLRYKNETENLWQGSEYLDNIAQTNSQFISDYYNFWQTIEVTNPLDNNQKIKPSLVEESGPPDNSTTLSGEISEEVDEKVNSLVFGLLGIREVTLAAETSVPSIAGQLQDAIDDFTNYGDGMETVRNQMDNWTVDNEETIRDYWLIFTFIIVLYGLAISLLFAVLLGGYLLNRKKKGHITGISLCVGLFTVVGLVSVVGLVAASIAVNDTCYVSNNMNTLQDIQSVNVLIPTDIAEEVNLCLNTNQTDLADSSEFGNLRTRLTPLLVVEKNFTGYSSLQASRLPDLETKNFTSFKQNNDTVHTTTRNYLNLFSNGTTDQAVQALSNLNKLSDSIYPDNRQINCDEGSKTKDEFATLEEECKFTSIVTPSEPKKGVGSNSCLIVQDWTESDLTNRYDGFLRTCEFDLLGELLNSVKLFQGYVESVNTAVASISEKIEELEKNIYTNVNLVVDKTKEVTDYNSTYIDPIFEKSVSEPTGILYNVDCRFSKTLFSNLQLSICDNALPSLLLIFTFLFLGSTLAFIFMFLALYLSRRLKVQQSYSEMD